MNAPAIKITRPVREQVSREEWEVRVNLAACYRLLAEYDMVEMVANHISARVPGEDHAFLINAYGMLYEEITASSLIKIDHDGNVIAKPDFGELVAELDGRVVGVFVVAPIELSSRNAGLARPEGATLLAWAATRPDVRGSGAGVALTEAAFAWARERGYRVVVTDWRETNLLASRFWPARGFRRTFLRLYRSIP